MADKPPPSRCSTAQPSRKEKLSALLPASPKKFTKFTSIFKNVKTQFTFTAKNVV